MVLSVMSINDGANRYDSKYLLGLTGLSIIHGFSLNLERPII